MIFKVMNADEWLWPIYGCKVGHSIAIGMKLEVDVWHHLRNVYTKFQIDISKPYRKKPENFENPKRVKIISKIPKMRFLHKTALISRSIQQAIYVRNLYWFMRPWKQKLGQIDTIVMHLKLDMSCHLLNVYTTFQIDIWKHVGKIPKNADGRTDDIIRPFSKRAYKTHIVYNFYCKWHTTP